MITRRALTVYLFIAVSVFAALDILAVKFMFDYTDDVVKSITVGQRIMTDGKTKIDYACYPMRRK